ncbi:unnamed protein product [Ixodes hexagonus]
MHTMLRQRGAASDSAVREKKSSSESSSSSSSSKNSSKQARSQAKTSRLLSRLLTLLVLVIVVVYVVIPGLFYASPWIRRQTVFLTFVNIPPFPNLTGPESYGLRCGQNLYVQSEPSVRLGVWYLPPDSLVRSSPKGCEGPTEVRDWLARDDQPVVVYLHGNGGSRAGGHRVSLYKILSKQLHAHVIAVDYRGYGDSSAVAPTAESIVTDAEAVYRWVREIAPPNKKVVLWGHSLGTGVSVYLLSRLSNAASKVRLPDGVVLEAPFDALHKVAQFHPLSLFHRYLPYFEAVFVDSIRNDAASNFDSVAKVASVSAQTPVMVLHARDDAMVPFVLGRNLYDAFEASRKGMKAAAPVTFAEFDAKGGYGHKHIHLNQDLPRIVRGFFTEVFVKKVK